MTDVTNTLLERGNNYGNFESHAEIAQTLKCVMRESSGYAQMEPHEKEALEMIFHKIARLLNGNPHHIDSYHDIQGYAKLVEDILQQRNAS